jgi:hypothetical protein
MEELGRFMIWVPLSLQEFSLVAVSLSNNMQWPFAPTMQTPENREPLHRSSVSGASIKRSLDHLVNLSRGQAFIVVVRCILMSFSDPTGPVGVDLSPASFPSVHCCCFALNMQCRRFHITSRCCPFEVLIFFSSSSTRRFGCFNTVQLVFYFHRPDPVIPSFHA